MKKILLLLPLFFTFSLADWYRDSNAYSYISNGVEYCLYDVVWNSDIDFNYKYNGVSYTNGTPEQLDSVLAENAFYYDDICNALPAPEIPTDAQTLGISDNDYNSLMALSGNLVGFTIMFMVSLVASISGRK